MLAVQAPRIALPSLTTFHATQEVHKTCAFASAAPIVYRIDWEGGNATVVSPVRGIQGLACARATDIALEALSSMLFHFQLAENNMVLTFCAVEGLVLESVSIFRSPDAISTSETHGAETVLDQDTDVSVVAGNVRIVAHDPRFQHL